MRKAPLEEHLKLLVNTKRKTGNILTFFRRETRKTLYIGLNENNLMKLFKFCTKQNKQLTWNINSYSLTKGNIEWEFRESTMDKHPARYVKVITEIVERR